MLYFAIPDYLWAYMIKLPVLRVFHKIGQKPLLALVLFCGAFSLYHIPKVMDTLKLNQSLHFASLGVLFILSVIAFWPVLNNVDTPEKYINYLFNKFYLFYICELLILDLYINNFTVKTMS